MARKGSWSAERVLIGRRFNGPPESAHGGYACGLVATPIDGCESASLRVPPPLERPLDIRRESERVLLLDGETVVAEAAPAELELEVPEPVPYGVAARASERPRWRDHHPFPTCFGCGPQRSQANAIAIEMGEVDGTGELCAGAWTPFDGLARGGEVTPLFMWAALDCPTSTACVPLGEPCVLARLTVRLMRPARAGKPHVVMAWLIGHEGRKHRGGAAIHTADGELCGYSEGLWIAVRDPATVGAAS